MGEDSVEAVRLGLMEVMENGFRKSKLFQMMKRIGSRKEKKRKTRSAKEDRRFSMVLGKRVEPRISYT